MNPTLVGSFAILMWSSLALFTVNTSNIPPLELLGISFSVAFIIGLIWNIKNGQKVFLKVSKKVWLVGVGGLFGYHFFYFLAIKNAPALEANLINYLWPLLIVLFSALLPNEKLRWYNIIGTFLGLVGAVVLILCKNGFTKINFEFHEGYIYAIISAILWASYSVLSRKFASVPTAIISAFCLIVAIMSFCTHFIFEITVVPSAKELFFAFLLGLGPVGGAFYVWDIGMKKGDIKLLGTLSYATPLLSTLMLIIFGLSDASWSVLYACFFIVTGSLISSGIFLKKV